MSKEITAPNGVVYQSELEMCQAYGVSYDTYQGRKHNGRPIEDCLNPIKKKTSIKHGVVAPNGRSYSSVKAMCEAYGVTENTFNKRRKMGLLPELCLSNRRLNYKEKVTL